MIAFPLDNTGYLAQALGAWLCSRTRGVFAADDHYAVTANGDMTITVSPGIAWLKAEKYWGTCMHEDTATLLTVATADGALARWAAVCIQLDKNLNKGGMVLKYGPYGTNLGLESLPLPAQNSLDFDEIYVAAIRIRAGATSILPGDITDLRLDETYCGIMRDGVTGLPTQQLHDAWLDWFGGLQASNELILDDLADTFRNWLQHLKNELDENQAGNLQNQIDQITGSVQIINVSKVPEEQMLSVTLSRALTFDEVITVELFEGDIPVEGTVAGDNPYTWTPEAGELPADTHKVRVGNRD